MLAFAGSELKREIQKENLHASRVRFRSGSPADADAPVCPECGKPMRRRTARKGPHAGQPFWGCTGYPECKGILTEDSGMIICENKACSYGKNADEKTSSE